MLYLGLESAGGPGLHSSLGLERSFFPPSQQAVLHHRKAQCKGKQAWKDGQAPGSFPPPCALGPQRLVAVPAVSFGERSVAACSHSLLAFAQVLLWNRKKR